MTFSGFKFHGLPALLCCILLTACTTQAPRPGDGSSPADRAKRAELAGQYFQASTLWREAADLADQPERDRYLSHAAEALLAAGDRQAAYRTLENIDVRHLENAERSGYALLRAEQALELANAEQARFYLDLARDGLEPGQHDRYLNIESSIIRLGVDPASELLARISRSLGSMSLSDPVQASNFVRSLETVRSGVLEQAIAFAPAHSLAGTSAALALRIRRSLVSSDPLAAAANQWAKDFPDSAVSRQNFLDTAQLYGSRFTGSIRVAVLLPIQGGLSSAGLAIRDGMLSAYLSNPQGSELRFYEEGDTPEAAVAAYYRALDDGAQWIIGPLRKESVDAVFDLERTTVPVLALNDTNSPVERAVAAPFYQLSLSQEEEAQSIAKKMLETGAMTVVTLVADTGWGIRMEQAFTEAFTAEGGEIIDMARLRASESDHSTTLKQALQIDQSQQRKDRLQAILGLPLSFEPHLRDDFDAFFMSANPEQARQLKPQLRFFEAGDKPVFAASRAFSGIENRPADQDLNGVFLPLTRAQITASNEGSSPALDSIRGGSLLNLYALGFDAWNLLSSLPLLQLDPDLSFTGAIGSLDLTPGGKLAREPSWAVFSGGRPTAMQWPEVAE